MTKVLKDKWLIVAYEKELNEERQRAMESAIRAHIDYYRGFSNRNNPTDPDPDFMWEDIGTLLAQRELEPNSQRFIDYRMLPRIIGRYNRSAEQYKGLSVLLNRDLFVDYNAVELFETILKSRFFRPDRESVHFACCFGDVIGGLTDSTISSHICDSGLHGCYSCQNGNVKVCKHTCYWRLIGLMLGAYPEPYSSRCDLDILNSLPKTYVH